MSAAAAVLALCGAAGCSGDSPKGRSGNDRAAQSTRAVPVPPVLLTVKRPPKTVTTASATIRGTVTPGAQVLVEGRRTRISGRRFRTTVALELGRNRITVIATKAGFRPARHTFKVIRTAATDRSPAGPAGPYQDRSGNPAPNPNCPPGSAPSGTGGGCAPYDENKPPPEPKINNPDCYKPNPPAGCF
ncbi:MAG TPA: hypothetical protein VF545_14225 [Thermoleophilaceae bacterium]|jgi:hypothetical protein